MNTNMQLHARKANLNDLNTIIQLYADDELGRTRETVTSRPDIKYIDAFQRIDHDANQYLMVVELNDQIIATCHLTLLPSLTFMGATRLLIEGVHVRESLRGKKIGEWMMNQAIAYARSNNASIIQLTSNKKRSRAIKFYEQLGFKATHEGMKLYLDTAV